MGERFQVADFPIACTLTSAERTARGDELIIGLAREATTREAVDDGYRFVFRSDPSLIRRIAETVIAERECCRFLTFEVAFEPDGGPITLTARGPAGTREFLDGLLSPMRP
jgi:hypothetical protein